MNVNKTTRSNRNETDTVKILTVMDKNEHKENLLSSITKIKENLCQNYQINKNERASGETPENVFRKYEREEKIRHNKPLTAEGEETDKRKVKIAYIEEKIKSLK